MEQQRRARELMEFLQPLMQPEDFYFLEASADDDDWAEVIELSEEYMHNHQLQFVA